MSVVRSLVRSGVHVVCVGCLPGLLPAQQSPIALPEFEIHSTRVANQEPSGTVAMPVTGLRFEPQVDVQARNLAEGQADVSIRGGTFANTGFRIGSLPLYDPQTGHYSAEVPIAPDMLGPPRIATGAAQAREGWNASVGSVAYRWSPITTGGHVALSAGAHDTFRGELHAGARGAHGLAADIAVAHSVSDGTIQYGDHEFTRYNARLQWATDAGQTDLFAGYQSKFFGWPNLYTPFNSPETEDIETVLFAANHRATWGANGSTIEIGVYHRRNKDDYAFDRFAPVGPVHPFQHTTWVTGAGLQGRWVRDEAWAVDFRASALVDRIESTSLLFGRFSTRTYLSAGVFPERQFDLGGGRTLHVSAGAAVDTTNRDSSTVTPVVDLTWNDPAAAVNRWSLSYSQASQVPDYTALNSSATSGLFRGNRHLGRAHSHNLELSAGFRAAGWRGTAAIFVRRDDDLVDWTFQNGVTARHAQAVDIDTGGIELFATRTFGWLDLMLGYTWLEKDADYGGATVDGSFYALNFPRHRFTAALIAEPLEGLELRLDNELRLQEENPLRRGGDEAFISAFGLYWRVPAFPRLQLSIQVDNLWNEDFEEVPAVPAARRLTTFGARWNW